MSYYLDCPLNSISKLPYVKSYKKSEGEKKSQTKATFAMSAIKYYFVTFL